MITSLAAGFGFGFIVAAQVGPIWLLCVRSVLRGRFLVGLAIGAGAAVIDVAYATLGVVGAASALQAEPELRLALGLIGSAVLITLGIRTLWSAVRIRQGMEIPEEVESAGRALRTALVATASNPLTIASWAAVFTATSAAHLTRTPLDAVALVVGIGFGSMTWFSVLSVVMSLARRRVGPKAIRLVDTASGMGLIGFGGLLGWRAVHPTGG